MHARAWHLWVISKSMREWTDYGGLAMEWGICVCLRVLPGGFRRQVFVGEFKIGPTFCCHQIPLAEHFPGFVPPNLPPPRGSDSDPLPSTTLRVQTLSTDRVPLGMHPPTLQARPHLDGSSGLGPWPLPILSAAPKTEPLPPCPKSGIFLDSISPRDPGLSNCPFQP